jgi:hypothetical protein
VFIKDTNCYFNRKKCPPPQRWTLFRTILSGWPGSGWLAMQLLKHPFEAEQREKAIVEAARYGFGVVALGGEKFNGLIKLALGAGAGLKLAEEIEQGAQIAPAVGFGVGDKQRGLY